MIPKQRDEVTGREAKENLLNKGYLSKYEMDDIFLNEDWFYGE